MEIDALIEKMNKLEFHQKLLLKMLNSSKYPFYMLVIEKSLGEKDVDAFFNLCDNLSIELEEQKAEGFVYFHPLYHKFKMSLHPNLHAEEVIMSCLNQRLFSPLMEEFRKYT